MFFLFVYFPGKFNQKENQNSALIKNICKENRRIQKGFFFSFFVYKKKSNNAFVFNDGHFNKMIKGSVT